MNGPTILHLGNPLVESIVAITIGLLAGVLIAASGRARRRS